MGGLDGSSTIESVEKEIISILEECRQQGMTREELLQVFSPLGISSWAGSRRPSTNTNKNKPTTSSSFKIVQRKQLRNAVILAVFVVTMGCLAMVIRPYLAHARMHGLALLRIALIKVLPIWNWTDLYYSRCLIRNPFYEQPNLNVDDCNLCETLEEIERLANASQAAIIEEFIVREKPLIVTDAMDNWSIMKDDQLWFDNITELYMHQGNYRVCNLNTNLRVGYGDITNVLRKLYSPHTKQWFLHWENCQKDGAKAIRQFYRRPYFISNSLDFTGSNWILMSSDFRGRVYKKIETRDSLVMLYQMRGFNHIRLSPRDACRGHCPELTATLSEGEIMVVTTLLWIFEYIPGEDADNLAILSEVSWPSGE